MKTTGAHKAKDRLTSILGLIAAFMVSALATPIPALGAPTDDAPVTLLKTRKISFVSTVNGREYQIKVAFPFPKADPKGYGVLYVMDGDAFFASAAEAARIAQLKVVVVGIGYPDSPAYLQHMAARHAPLPPGLDAFPLAFQPFILERSLDLTPPLSAPHASPAANAVNAPVPPETGGVDAFLETIEKDVKPRVASLAHINPADQALFGHSYGGLAVLRALFREPNAFQTYIAASPAIYFGDSVILQSEQSFEANVKAGAAKPRIIITVGGEEETPPPLPPGSKMDRAIYEQSFRRSRMIGNARELSARLKALQGPQGYEVGEFAVFPGLTHPFSVLPAIALGLSFAFQSPQ